MKKGKQNHQTLAQALASQSGKPLDVQRKEPASMTRATHVGESSLAEALTGVRHGPAELEKEEASAPESRRREPTTGTGALVRDPPKVERKQW